MGGDLANMGGNGGQIRGEMWQKPGEIGQKWSRVMRSREKRRAVKSFCRNIFGLIDKRDGEEDVVKLDTIGGRDVSQAAEDDSDGDDDDEKEEEVAKLDTIGRRDVSQAEL